MGLKWFVRTGLIIATIVLSAVIAWLICVVMGELGAFGTCFEGACAYAIIFFWFPVLWLVTSAVSVGALCLLGFRRRSY